MDIYNPWLTGLAMILAALSPIISAIAVYYSAKAKQQSEKTAVSVDGRMKQLLESVNTAAFLAGKSGISKPPVPQPPEPSDAAKSPPRV